LQFVGKRKWRVGRRELTLNLPREVARPGFDRTALVYFEETDKYLVIVYKFPRRRGQDASELQM